MPSESSNCELNEVVELDEVDPVLDPVLVDGRTTKLASKLHGV